MQDNKQWDRIAYIFVWTIRTSAKLFNGTYTPYETITGLKPRTPVDCLCSPAVLRSVPHQDYVTDLVKYMKHVHSFVEQEHQRVRESEAKAQLRKLGAGHGGYSVGDYVLVSRPKEANVSNRFQSSNYDDVFQVVEIHGPDGDEARAYTLCDVAGSREIRFSQPVHVDRLTPVEVLPLAQISDDQHTRIEVDHNGTWFSGTVCAQSADCLLYTSPSPRDS